MSRVSRLVYILGLTTLCSGLYTLGAHANDGNYRYANDYVGAALNGAERGYLQPATYRRHSSRGFSSRGFRNGSRGFNRRGFSNRRFSRSSRYNSYRRYRSNNRYYNRSYNPSYKPSYSRGYRSSRSFRRSY